jgi:hypothetical protein
VQSFIDNCVQALKNDSSGQLKDSWSEFSAAACANNISATFPSMNNTAHMELEIDMLKKILSTPSADNKKGKFSYPNIKKLESTKIVFVRAQHIIV